MSEEEKIEKEKLKNCPFCGSDNLELRSNTPYYVSCKTCSAKGSKFYRHEHGQIRGQLMAILSWNIRGLL